MSTLQGKYSPVLLCHKSLFFVWTMKSDFISERCAPIIPWLRNRNKIGCKLKMHLGRAIWHSLSFFSIDIQRDEGFYSVNSFVNLVEKLRLIANLISYPKLLNKRWSGKGTPLSVDINLFLFPLAPFLMRRLKKGHPLLEDIHSL